MPRYEVYATAWNSPTIVEELIPAAGLEFSLPLSDHGTCSFTATVEPGRSFWRPSITPVLSGVLVARDGVPVWQGWVTGERQVGPRSFSFECVEWGAFFERVPAAAKTYTQWDDQDIFRDLITRAAASAPGRDPGVDVGSGQGSTSSDLTVAWWDGAMVERLFRDLAESGGPEWYFGSTGTLQAPVRRLYLGGRLGHTTAQTVLEYVEDTQAWDGLVVPPRMAVLGDLFGGGVTSVPVSRRGGNVVAMARTRDTDSSATEVVALGAGEERTTMQATVAASTLLGRGWPRLSRVAQLSDVKSQPALARRAQSELASSAGITTGYSLVTLDGEPDWTATPRGSTVRVVLDTDIFGAERPVGGPDGFDTRLLSTTVRVADDGPAQVQWDTATVMEAS